MLLQIISTQHSLAKVEGNVISLPPSEPPNQLSHCLTF